MFFFCWCGCVSVCVLIIRLIINFQLLALGVCQVLWLYRNCHICIIHTHTHRTHMIKRKDHHMPIFNYFNDFEIGYTFLLFHFQSPNKKPAHQPHLFLSHSLPLYWFIFLSLHIPSDLHCQQKY